MREAHSRITIHPVDGRAARSGRNNLRLTSLQRDLAETQRLLDEARLLKDHPELRQPSDEWVPLERRIAALTNRVGILRREIEAAS